MYEVKTTINFEAAHRLYDVATYSEECRKNLHGHSYKVTVYIAREKLNDASMVIDFKLLKKILKEVIEDKYDHSCILRSIDPVAEHVKANCDKVRIVEENPTAEWMAMQFYYDILEALNQEDNQLLVNRVEVQETEKNIACYHE